MDGGNDQIRLLQKLLEDFEPLLTKVRIRRHQTAERFNVFEALHVDGYEAHHSRFIAYLLDPAKHHDQGDDFLSSFLQRLGLDFDRTSTQGAGVRTELPLGPSGRIDIRLRLANGQIILIENKIGAQEGKDQISRYEGWLQPQEAPPCFPHRVVFLTPDGRRPETARKPQEVICCSYLRLADWINHQAVDKPERLRVILEQYAETCGRIGGSVDKEKFITIDNERIKFYLEHREQIEELVKIKEDLSEFAHEFYASLLDEILNEVGHRGIEVEISLHEESIRLRRHDWPLPEKGPAIELGWHKAWVDRVFSRDHVWCGIWAQNTYFKQLRSRRQEAPEYPATWSFAGSGHPMYRYLDPPSGNFWEDDKLKEYGDSVVQAVLKAWDDLARLIDETVSQSSAKCLMD